MRSKCHKIERLISDYIDSTLSERQTADVTSHIRNCRSCKREVADLKKTKHLLKNFYIEPEAPDTYYAQFTTQLRQRIEESAPTAPHQRIAAAATRFGWQLRTAAYRYADYFRLSRFISIRQHVLPYYVLTVTMIMLIATPFLLTHLSLDNGGEHVRSLSTAVQSAVTQAVQQDDTASYPVGTRRNLNSERTTETPTVDSGSDIWKFTNDRVVDGYIFTTLHKESSDTVPSVALDIDSELFTYAESSAQDAISERLTGRDVLTDRRYALLLLRGINTRQHARQQYERKRSEFRGFSHKLLDVPLEMMSVEVGYDLIEL